MLRFLRVGSAVFLCLATVALIVSIGRVDPEGYYGQATAAWMQAIFSVLAIVAAIVIERQTTFRQEAAERRVRQRATRHRVDAILHFADALDRLADQVRDTEIPDRGWCKPSSTVLRSVRARGRVVGVYVDHGSEVYGPLLAAVAQVERISIDTNAYLDSIRVIRKPDQEEFVLQIRNASDQVREALVDYEAEVEHRVAANRLQAE